MIQLSRWLEIKNQFIQFLFNPVEKIKTPPNLTWTEILLVQVALSAASGFLSGVIAGSPILIILNLFFNPIVFLITTSVVSLIFFYLFLFFFKRVTEYKKVYEILFFAHLPFLILLVINPLFPPIVLVGLALTSVLLVVGFSHHFQLPKRKVAKLVAGIYLVLVLIWAYNLWESRQIQNRWSFLGDSCMPKATLASKSLS